MAVKKKIDSEETQETNIDTNQETIQKEESVKSSNDGSIESWGTKILQAIQGLSLTSQQTQTTTASQTPIQMELPKLQKEKEDPIKKETRSFLSKMASFF
jgi:hypothetical protein